ncbi:unnamed protein product [Aspergillus oryzae]|uniref:Anaphase-promoting complex subunit 4 n=2 Tax=Aspergillus oryzae TaxID=5062 RepID=A0AAN4YU42_ASPOZ|nr:unnamed protein product [Aspergillus oryzae]GMF86994.1 unnamed protein product [Aspergillus oryzae]GMG00434.1 unnamed protein product [Aspergillus oryzae]GMG34213.1 unnamed protein product [Aspergillus oryzae]GMG49135.1 unnamed protein product [Aspergillus oryzae var. brunneus]
MAEDNSHPPSLRHEPQLTPVAEKSLPAKCKTTTLKYCPTMDLISLVTEDDELRVFRLNGQKVFGGSFKGDPYLDEDDGGGEIRKLMWKNNGASLAFSFIYCSFSCKLSYFAYSGKIVHHYPVYEEQSDADRSVKVTCLGWGVNFTDSQVAQQQLKEAAGQISVEDLLSSDVHPSKAAALLKADLPRELALLDIESSLPKLSTLPATGSDSRASIDAIFHSAGRNTNDAVDVLLVGFDDGTVHLRIFDCFEIGSFQVGSSVGPSSSCRILQHASHPLSSTHALLASSHNDDSPDSLHLLTLDLRFITRSGRYLSLLAHKTTQLQNLLRYINQVQRQVELEWKNAQELPARYMRSINEDLQEKCHCDFVTAAYHLVVTGDCFEPMKEFLVDIVGERTADLNGIVETLDCLHLLSHHILINANEELSQFNSFSRWLRHEIEMQSAEPMSQTLEELQEKTDMVEYPQTLKYIRGALTKSKLRNFIQQLPLIGFARPAPSTSDKWAPTEHDGSFYDTFKKLLEQSNQASDADAPAELPKMNDLTKRLGLQFEKVFGQIALTQRRGILHRSPLALHPDCDKDIVDLVMRYEDYDSYITSSTPAAPTVTLDVLAQESESTQWIKHAFTIPGPKLKPTRIYVNGRHDRRAICVLYGDGLRYEVLDLDAEMEDEEEEDEEPEEDSE